MIHIETIVACDSILLPFYIWPPNVMTLVPPLANQQYFVAIACRNLSRLHQLKDHCRIVHRHVNLYQQAVRITLNKKVMKQKQNI